MSLAPITTILAPYAVTEENSRGRQYGEPAAFDRTGFQRDYSRIIYSNAWRALSGKTQVFSVIGTDLFRTRSSHSLEVAQVAKTMASHLRVNPDLAATLAVAHDLGHAPFGHLGQDVLNEMMQPVGGFEHNLHGLKIVDELESPYLDFPGLNLMFETREGLLKRCSPETAAMLGSVAERHIKNQSPTLEAQIVDWSDAWSYLHADLEDAALMKLLNPARLMEIDLFKKTWNDLLKTQGISRRSPSSELLFSNKHKEAEKEKKLIKTALRSMLSLCIRDTVKQSKINIEANNIQSLDDVRNSPWLISPSEEFAAHQKQIRLFSKNEIYQHPIIADRRLIEEKMLKTIFRGFMAHPEKLPGGYNGILSDLPLFVGTHIASMTDRGVYDQFHSFSLDFPIEFKEWEKPALKKRSPSP